MMHGQQNIKSAPSNIPPTTNSYTNVDTHNTHTHTHTLITVFNYKCLGNPSSAQFKQYSPMTNDNSHNTYESHRTDDKVMEYIIYTYINW
jgi:hypothetical protein